MLTLGIWAFGRDSSAVLVDDTSIVAAIEEEKLSRSTGMGGIPRMAISRCLEQRNAKITDVQLAAFPRRPALSALREAGFRLRNVFSGSRAACAYFTSPFERALVLTLDERGDMRSGSLYLGEGDELRLLRPLRFPNSLGWFYSCVTELLGFRARRDEHKVQWLSKDGRPEFVSAFRKLFHWDSDGLPVLNTRYLRSCGEEDTAFSEAVLRDLRLGSRVIASDPEMRASLARSARDFIAEIVLTIAERYRKRHSVDCLCVAGGLFLNVFLVRALETRSSFKQVYVQPVAGNSGTAVGAALLARKRLGRPARQPLDHLYLGPGFSSGEIKAVLDNCKIIYRYPSGDEQLLAEAAQVLSRDKIVAWFHGRTEFGHRALGNRSILASPFS